MVDENGIPKLANFEFGCQYEHSDTPVIAGIIIAPPLAPNPTRWDAPEMFKDASDSRAPFPTRYTDLWSLGCLFVFVSRPSTTKNGNTTDTQLQVYCYKLPYPDNELPGAIARIMKGEKPYPPDVCPSSVWELANLLWEKIPYGRISAAKALSSLAEM
jgi:serine/threonine protein kinase